MARTTRVTKVTKERVAKKAGGKKEAKESRRTKVRKDNAREPQLEAVAKKTLTLPATAASVACGVTNRRTAEG
eukprot:1862237-Amphidinium_carterae.1